MQKRRRHCDNGGREQCSQKPRNVWRHQKLKEQETESPLQPSEKVWVCWNLSSDFWLSELWGNKFFIVLGCQICGMCYGSHRKLIYISWMVSVHIGIGPSWWEKGLQRLSTHVYSTKNSKVIPNSDS